MGLIVGVSGVKFCSKIAQPRDITNWQDNVMFAKELFTAILDENLQGMRCISMLPAATPEFLARLATLLQDPKWEVQQAAIEAVKAVGPAAATPEILARLATLLQDSKWWVRWAAVEAVRAVGAAAATPE
ncbi:MAG: HEAT repeat domain-containing protein, partial [Nitrospinota bacterium]